MIAYAPRGRLLVSGDRVCCHLCGRWFLSVASHLRAHGWTKADYVAEFGLEISNPLCGPTTTKRRAAAMTGRQVHETAIRRAQSAARARARSGELTRQAAEAARGRPHPPQRRRKTLAALAHVSPERQAVANRERARRELADTAQACAEAQGFASFADYAAARLIAGWSLTAISREAGQHRNWLARHRRELLGDGAPDGRTGAPAVGLVAARATGLDARWPVADVGAYLRRRHVDEHASVAAIAAETGVSRASVVSALRRHGLPVVTHATSRHAAAERETGAVTALGFASLADYVAQRRRRGASWAALAAECGLPATTLRRRAD